MGYSVSRTPTGALPYITIGITDNCITTQLTGLWDHVSCFMHARKTTLHQPNMVSKSFNSTTLRVSLFYTIPLRAVVRGVGGGGGGEGLQKVCSQCSNVDLIHTEQIIISNSTQINQTYTLTSGRWHVALRVSKRWHVNEGVTQVASRVLHLRQLYMTGQCTSDVRDRLEHFRITWQFLDDRSTRVGL